jgi:hypothetical protein
MKKIMIMLLLSIGFTAMAQDKPVVTKNGQIVNIKGVMLHQFYIESTGHSDYFSTTFNNVPGLADYSYTAPQDGTLLLQTELYSILVGPSTTSTAAATRNHMMVLIDGNPVSYGAASVATPNSSLFTRTVLNWATPVNIVTKFKVTKGTTYTITVQARTMEGQASGVYGGYVGTYESNGLTAPSSMTGTLIPD